MGGKKKSKQVQAIVNKKPAPAPKPVAVTKQTDEEKRFVNLLHVYTVYKQKFRRISKEEFEVLLRHGCKGKKPAVELCKEFMKAKQIPYDVNFEKNVGFLSLPRFLPLIALLAERADYKMKPSLVSKVDFSQTPDRFKEKFAHLLVYGFWFLGRVISDSLSVKEQVNRGNVFNFAKGDMGFWWAGVRILDWCLYVHRNKVNAKSCHTFVTRDPPKHRHYTSRAIINMHQHPLYFLSELDWTNYTTTVKSIRHDKIPHYNVALSSINFSDEETPSEDVSSSMWSSDSDVNSFLRTDSEASLNTLASRESVD